MGPSEITNLNGKEIRNIWYISILNERSKWQKFKIFRIELNKTRDLTTGRAEASPHKMNNCLFQPTTANLRAGRTPTAREPTQVD